jgi:23S rRNA (uracil1939-C5)-methyltransferase
VRPTIDGEATALGRAGEAWVETERGGFWVSGVVPGDRVRIEPEPEGRSATAPNRRRGARDAIRSKSTPPRARLVEVLEASPDRVEPTCAVAGACGGCPLMVASQALEAEAKRARVAAALEGVPRAPGLEVAWRSPGPALGYRRRVRMAFRAAAPGEGARLGYRHRRGHAILDVEACPVLEPPLEAALAQVRAALLPALRGGGELRLGLVAARPVQVVIAVDAEAMQPPEAYAAAEALAARPEVAGVALQPAGLPPAVFGDPREAAIGLDGEAMRASVAGFAQANDAVNRALVEEAVALAEAEGASVLELYAGAGNLTVPLAARASRLVAVEIAQEALDAARANLEARGLRAHLVHAKAEDAPPGRFDVVALDPPRAGAAEAIPRVVEARPKRIVYVSCDPGTLGRDLRALGAAGYVADSAAAFDMFPRTAHVEALVRLVRA